MSVREEDVFVAACKTCCWPAPQWKRCDSCGADFEPDVVLEDVGVGTDKAVGYWVESTWSASGVQNHCVFCWGCAGLFMSGDYRGASHDYEVDLEEFAAAIQRVARRERHAALNPQESDYPTAAVELIDFRLEQARRLESAYVVDRKTFDRECREVWSSLGWYA